LIFNFYCAKPYQATYQPIAEAMINTIHVNTKQASKAIPVVIQPQIKGLNSSQILEEQKKRNTKAK